ncbi:MAG TPA: hypothetical protein VFI83_09070 [Gaiella sp.]|nr:hypothetical protein [Gaiella sp.]
MEHPQQRAGEEESGLVERPGNGSQPDEREASQWLREAAVARHDAHGPEQTTEPGSHRRRI